MKKLLTQCFLFLLLFSTWWGFRSWDSYITSGKITAPLPVFPSIQIDLLKSPNKSNVEDALQRTVKPLLAYIAPDLAAEIWQAEYLFIDLLSGQEEEVVISLSLKPDRGILVILQKQHNQYVLLYLLDNLLPITKLDSLDIDENRRLLVTREDHEERLGSYSEVRIVKIWNWYKDSLFLVWSDNSFWEVNWLNTWQDPGANPKKWFRLVQDISISYQAKPQPTLLFKGQQSYLEAPTEKEILPSEQDFTLKNSRQIESVYHWDDNWHRFILGTGVLNSPELPSQRIAILMDMENHLEAMVVKDKRLYQILDKNGKNFLVDKQYIRLDP